jgi:hypothetical protein
MRSHLKKHGINIGGRSMQMDNTLKSAKEEPAH